MDIPRFLIGDNTEYSDAIFVIHTEFPRFIINLVDDEVEWIEDLQEGDVEELANQVSTLIEEASTFYDREMKRYEEA